MVMLPDNSPRFSPPPFQHGRIFVLGVPYVPESQSARPVYKEGKLFAVCVGDDVCFPKEFVANEVKNAIDGAYEDHDRLVAEVDASALLRGIVIASMVWVFALVIVGVVLA